MELDAVVEVAGGETASRQDAVAALFREHAVSLVRLARLFVDDRNAAEDLVQEAFIRLDRSLHRISQPERAAAYLRTIVLNLARDHNRRGLVSLRHRLPEDRQRWSPVEDDLIVREDQRKVLEELRRLPKRQRDCLVLHYFMELTVPAITETLGLSVNSVKTHLRRARAALTTRLEGHASASKNGCATRLVPASPGRRRALISSPESSNPWRMTAGDVRDVGGSWSQHSAGRPRWRCCSCWPLSSTAVAGCWSGGGWKDL